MFSIVLFDYNHPCYIKQKLEASQNDELARDREFFIYNDEYKIADEVGVYIDSIDSFKKVTVIKREINNDI